MNTSAPSAQSENNLNQAAVLSVITAPLSRVYRVEGEVLSAGAGEVEVHDIESWERSQASGRLQRNPAIDLTATGVAGRLVFKAK